MQIEEIKKLECQINKKYDNLYSELQYLNIKKYKYLYKKNFKIIFPPLNLIVHKKCNKILTNKFIIWIGGPPGSGKSTLTKRFQDYGFMTLDGEYLWNKNYKYNRFQGLTNISNKIYNELNCSFVLGACYGKYLLEAPKYVIPILLLPDKNVYTKRWKNRNPNDKQPHEKRYNDCVNLSKNAKILTLHQPINESIDVSIYRICDLIINKYNL